MRGTGLAGATACSVLVACASACSADRLVGAEAWTTPPEIRIAVVARAGTITVRALSAQQPVEEPLAGDETAELWLFSYRADTLRDAFPGLAHASVAEILAQLSPSTDARSGLTPPPADEILSADLDPAQSSITYRRRSWTEWTQRSPQGLTFRLQLPDEAVCGDFAVTRTPVPAGVHFDGLVAAGDERVFFSGSVAGSTTSPVQLYGLAGGQLRALAARTERGPSYGHPSWDPVTATVWDIDADAQLYRYDAAGQPQPVPDPPMEPGVVPQAQWVSVGTDGTLMATYLHPSDVGHGTIDISPALFEHGAQGWDFALIRDGSFGFVEVERADRILTYYHCWIYYYQDPAEQNGWKQELLDDACLALRDVDMDPDGAIVVGTNGFARLRDEAGRTWIDATLGLPRQTFVAAAMMRKGRAVVGSSEGAIFVRRGPRWCPIDHGVADAHVERAAGAPEGDVAYLLVQSGDAAQEIVRVEIE